jgi:heme exporter protein A
VNSTELMPGASRELRLDHVWKFYGDYAALRDCTLSIGEGACCALLGRNGAGKTTLLRILAGLSPFQKGEIRLFGAPPRSEEARRQIGFLGHGIGVYEDLSARENLRFYARLAAVSDPDKVAAAWLDRVGLDRVARMPVRQFSRGMRQRLALARTFLHSPQLLLLDEPFTSLDDCAMAMLSELLLEAKQKGTTIILSTHQLREALAIASHIALIENGRFCFSGERTQEMIDDPSYLYRLYTRVGAA